MLFSGGCKTGAIGSLDAGPFMFATSGLPNDCMVESVRFHDAYFSNPRSRDGWLRVLQWGVKEGFTVNPGHAVAVYEWRGKLAVFDTNKGIYPLDVPLSFKTDLHEIGPPIFAQLPNVEPTGPTYLIDSRRRQKPGFEIARNFPNAPKYHPMLRAAKSLARYREVRVIQFAYNAQGERINSAAIVFVFDGQLCVYTRERGTLVTGGLFARPDNDPQIRQRLERAFGDGSDVRLM